MTDSVVVSLFFSPYLNLDDLVMFLGKFILHNLQTKNKKKTQQIKKTERKTKLWHSETNDNISLHGYV